MKIKIMTQNLIKIKASLLSKIFPVGVEFINAATGEEFQINFGQMQGYLSQSDNFKAGQLQYLNSIVEKLITIVGTDRNKIAIGYIDGVLKAYITDTNHPTNYPIKPYNRIVFFSYAISYVDVWIKNYFTLLDIIDTQKNKKL